MEFINKNGIKLDVVVVSLDRETVNQFDNLLYNEVVDKIQRNVTTINFDAYLNDQSLFIRDPQHFENEAEYVAHGYSKWDYSNYKRVSRNLNPALFIEPYVRELTMYRLFNDAKTFMALFAVNFSDCPFEYYKRLGLETFDGGLFFRLYILGCILNSITKSVGKVYVKFGYLIELYYEGITKSSITKLIDSATVKFMAEFFSKGEPPNVLVGSHTIKYVPKTQQVSKDRFGNEINIGDLVISPQGGHNTGSWVDPFIVGRIVGNRLYVSEGGRGSYYLAERCIVLRSKFENKLTYGELDWM